MSLKHLYCCFRSCPTRRPYAPRVWPLSLTCTSTAALRGGQVSNAKLARISDLPVVLYPLYCSIFFSLRCISLYFPQFAIYALNFQLFLQINRLPLKSHASHGCSGHQILDLYFHSQDLFIPLIYECRHDRVYI